ncbi:glycosyltransferase [Microbacterium radiodurans]|uniref:glycosyltransferase n=1 Tax=Microbacterium radiodurans TaxID=661398 RepID=UPI001CC5CD44|nr:glycosyltransferase [Microbacterium radiodurans]
MRVAAVPAGHPYVRRVTAAAGVELQDDPPVPGAPAGVWWPPVVLDPAWIRAAADDVDLLHIHFGTESFGPGHLTACLDAAHAAGWPVVFTVHDLIHPQLSDQSPYAAQLDEIVPRADALVTLTSAAAAEIRERWGREAVVLPHPSIIGDEDLPAVAVGEELRIGMHLKDLRPGTDGARATELLVDAVDTLRAGGLHASAEVRMHRTVRDPDARDDIRRRLGTAAHVRLVEHDRLSDAELHTDLAGLDACVLPYRAGTHSGWLELCWDLGVPVAAPAVGCFADQHPDDGSTATFAPGDAAALAEALTALVTGREAARPGSLARAERAAERRAMRRETDAATAAAHAQLYRDLIRGRAS